MKLLLTAVLLAAALPSGAETVSLHYASDGTPTMKVPAGLRATPVSAPEFCADPKNIGMCRVPGPFDYKPVPVKVRPLDAAPASKELAQASLPERLDATTRIPELYWQFNKRKFYTATALDRDNKIYFAFFTGKAGEEVCEPEDGRLLNSSIPVQLDQETKYVITLQINLFDPQKSSLLYSPAQGFGGALNKIRVDTAMALVQAAGVQVPFSKGGLTFFYSTDVDAKTKKLADTRTLSFVKEAWRDTKSYAIREEEMPKDKWVSVNLGAQPALLYRTQEDLLRIHEPI